MMAVSKNNSAGKKAGKGLLYLLMIMVVVTAVDLWRSKDLPTDIAALGAMTTLNGEVLDLKELSQDEPVLVYVWATWCGVCRVVSPMVDMVNTPVVSIALASGHDAKVAGYVRDKGYDFSVVNDEDHRLGQTLGISVTPTLMVAHKGQLRFATAGITILPGMVARLWLARLMG
ncbi:protein disulfide oxidoreductase [Oceanisphaera arctica]|uniref:Protein disulfide oxidoreductase n=1 Tax=Oceanisphaera arctica TaxID=641510 RepID=A0A2P5TLI3_9GAMM|nr:protein disulfide oxidoreductase [Oceanisphaera arctica]PPL16099.1 protein disulfide oxidoreductase [Oceanisphaera arctica]GHA26363.1 protein disulfide oxidoreductase [Oceanisphaera arctica]